MGTLSTNAACADNDRRLPSENLDALREAGMLRLATPIEYGGQGADLRTALPILADLGQACSSTAWVLSLYYSSAVVAGLYPRQVREQIWRDNPDATVCGALGTPRLGTRVPGGVRVSDRWSWVSGIHHADWIGLDLIVNGERGLGIVPVTDVSVEDTWQMAGMRGTGSDTVVAEDLFIPEERFLSLSRWEAGDYQRPHEPLTWLPLRAIMLPFVGSVLGMGRGLLVAIVAKIREGAVMVGGAGRAGHASVLTGIAEAAILLDCAVLLATRSATEIDQAGLTGVPMDPKAEARIRMDVSFAARQVRRAADMLMDAGGSSRFATTDSFERVWRDIGTATRHPAMMLEVNALAYGQSLLQQSH
jgi:3-hydroxy-9,10-secoandrosta-1,3,5(10)-triene-9,17-dione monooxygenase